MRCYYLVLIPPMIISLWTIFYIYNAGVGPRDVRKRLQIILNESEALFKHMVRENDTGTVLVDSVQKRSGQATPQKARDEVSSQLIKSEETSPRMRSGTAGPQKQGEQGRTSLTKTEKRNNKSIESKNAVNCPKEGQHLVGPLRVDRGMVRKMEDVEKSFSLLYRGWVEIGGAWRPEHCQAVKKVAIILPYRNRYEQLKMFLRHLHPILKRQLLDYRIFVVEQAGNTIFNRAILFNIGFKESQKFNDYECFIFHDVDLLPENDRNPYNCPTSPRHMCPAVDKFHYRLPYADLFGGVEALSKEHFEQVNGFSNKYWGWGGEDDDLHHRCNAKGLKLTRASMRTGRYKMLKEHHHVDDRKNKKKTRQLLNGSVSRMKHDGLNTLKYTLLQTDSPLLYTHIKVAVDPSTV